MCGIFGVVNSSRARNVNSSVSRFISNAFVAGALRGEDSSGVFQIEKKGQFAHKLAIHGAQFAEDKVTKRFISDADVAWATVGHNRAATEGKVIAANAHPFTVWSDDAIGEAICGVHNGTLSGWKTKLGGKDHEVDSEWALKTIMESGDAAFKEFQGSFCFVWHDTRTPSKLYIARNSDRPMHFIYTKDGGRMLLASEPGMLTWLAERNNLLLEDNIYVVEAGNRYTFDMDNPKAYTKTAIELAKWTTYTSYTSSDDGTSFLTSLEKAVKKAIGGGGNMSSVIGAATELRPTNKEKGPKKYVQSSAAGDDTYVYPATLDEAIAAEGEGVWNKKYSVRLEMHDDRASETYATILDSEGKDTVHTCMFRNMSEKLFHRLNRKPTIDCYVAGIHTDTMGQTWYIGSLCDLNLVPDTKLPILGDGTIKKVVH